MHAFVPKTPIAAPVWGPVQVSDREGARRYALRYRRVSDAAIPII